MNQVLDFPHGNNICFKNWSRQIPNFNTLKILQQQIRVLRRNSTAFKRKNCRAVLSPLPVRCKLVDLAERSLEEKDTGCNTGEFTSFPPVKTLRNFPKDEIFKKVVMVRLDSIILHQTPPANAVSTIKYLHEAGAKIVLVSSWSENGNSRRPSQAYPSAESAADFLSSILELKVVPVKLVPGYIYSDGENLTILLLENLFGFKGESANYSKFAKELSSGVDIIVNDAFSQSHKVLASTIGVACYCYASLAGFYFEECLDKIKKIVGTGERPYMAIVLIGGGNLADKASALRFLAYKCDGLIFVGTMAFQIMHALRIPIPMEFVEHGALKEAASIVDYAKSRNVPLILPIDFWCINNSNPKEQEIFSANSIPKGSQPVDIGPRSLQEMIYLVSKCKKITWIGPLRFSSSRPESSETFKLVGALSTLHRSSCDITFVGKLDFEELFKSDSFSNDNFVKNAAVVWEVLKGRKLPGLMALDREYPFRMDWSVAYGDPTQPLVVDIGCGNGLFLFGMARTRKDMNFLGLEINAKLVDRCVDEIHQFGIQNLHFLATNATSTFRSIVSTYPGELVLVSIQCPIPDFNNPEYRRRMLQRSLVEAIIDVLMLGGKVFLQSDIEAVALRMKKQFLEYSKGRLVILNSSEDKTINEGQWLEENPFGVSSDWEQHVLDRGDPMYRILLSKVEK